MATARAFYSAMDLSPRLAMVNPRWRPCTDWMTGSLAHRKENAKHGSAANNKTNHFNSLIPPYFFSAVRSFGEYGAERDEIRPRHHSGSQELFAKKPANTGYFCRWNFGERNLPKGRMAEGEVLETNRLGGEKRSA